MKQFLLILSFLLPTSALAFNTSQLRPSTNIEERTSESKTDLEIILSFAKDNKAQVYIKNDPAYISIVNKNPKRTSTFPKCKNIYLIKYPDGSFNLFQTTEGDFIIKEILIEGNSQTLLELQTNNPFIFNNMELMVD